MQHDLANDALKWAAEDRAHRHTQRNDVINLLYSNRLLKHFQES